MSREHILQQVCKKVWPLLIVKHTQNNQNYTIETILCDSKTYLRWIINHKHKCIDLSHLVSHKSLHLQDLLTYAFFTVRVLVHTYSVRITCFEGWIHESKNSRRARMSSSLLETWWFCMWCCNTCKQKNSSCGSLQNI